MIIAIHSYVSPEARLLISDHDSFNQATVEACSIILNNALDEIREEFKGRVCDSVVFHRMAGRVNNLAKHVQSELEHIWRNEDRILSVRPKCTFEGASTLRVEVLPQVCAPLSTSIH